MQNRQYIHKKRVTPSVDELYKGILSGDLTALSQGITRCESKKQKDRTDANALVQRCLKHSGKSVRVGITGVPGVGKSTFIEGLGVYLIQRHQKKVAVLAVDPSSQKTKGSILGDKTRMNELSTHEQAYIRPSPSSGSLGGVTHHSRESIILCEAAGFDVIVVETVGVGQSEIEVKEMTDFFLLLMLAGAGDELQGIKRGIMEMADGILINKADGENIHTAKKAKREYQNALHLFPPSDNKWVPKVDVCSALEKINMDNAWGMIEEYLSLTRGNGFFKKQRIGQLKNWFHKSIDQHLNQSLLSSELVRKEISLLEKKVIQEDISPTEAAAKVFEVFKKSL